MARYSIVVWFLGMTVILHIAQVTYYTSPGGALEKARGGRAAGGGRAAAGGGRLLIVTATQPAPCTTQHGDYIVQLALKNKLQYATRHGYAVWASTELLSPWDLGGQWNKVALLSVLAEGNSSAAEGFEWLLWVDDDAIFCDMSFTFPFDAYDEDDVHLVLWGDEAMTYGDGNSEGVNTGTMLLRRCEWTRQLLAAWAALASSPVRETLVNHDQGGLVHLLFHQRAAWRQHTRLERNFTMNGHWPSYVGRLARGQRQLKAEVWGSTALPFLLHYSGCQMCRGHSFNGTWTEAGVDACRRGFMEAFTFADDMVLQRIGLRHPRLGMMGARPNPGSLLHARHARLTRCMPSLLVVGTQKGGTSSLHYIFKAGWHARLRVNEGEKEVHYFSLDDVYAKGAALYQQRWDGPSGKLGECADNGEVRTEISASYLDYPKAAERAAALVPAARVLVLLREPVGRLVSSFNMRWQIEVCGKLTWTRRDCYRGVTSRAVIRDNAVGPFQKAQALKVWSKCARGEKALSADCLRLDFAAKLRNRTRTEMAEIDACARGAPGEPLGACLQLAILGQRKLYKRMEDHAFIYRSVYHEHLQQWLRHYPAAQLLVLPSEALFLPATIKPTMQRIARFVGLPDSGDAVHEEVLFTASPASTGATPHENGREYIAEAPEDVNASVRAWLCPRNRLLSKLLLRHKLLSATTEMPWLHAALTSCGPGMHSAPGKLSEKSPTNTPDLEAVT
ncbi:hypothetical protein AB1Y20_011528 [Prymnesium parvum]|uniref:Sulfotransferase domain-containing protein n=1 Tax=Prymnesium parvum TaxID=97485 RepID=A0AB34IGT3_PRYPA